MLILYGTKNIIIVFRAQNANGIPDNGKQRVVLPKRETLTKIENNAPRTQNANLFCIKNVKFFIMDFTLNLH